MATFGELLSAADGHLAQAASTLNRPDIDVQAQHPGTIIELARLTAVLARYGDNIADGFGLQPNGDEAVREAARRFSRNIHQARNVLGTPGRADPSGPDLAWTLRAASDTLGCGLDLLNSHFTRTSGGGLHSPSANAMTITAGDVLGSLLHKLGRYAEAAGHLTRRSTPEAAKAADPLIRAADSGPTPASGRASPVEAVTLRRAMERIPPVPGESTARLLEGISTSAQRLRNMDPQGSIATWRYLATAAAIACQIGSRITSVMAYRFRETGEEELAAPLLEAARRTRLIGMRWQTLAQNWRSLTGMPSNPATVPAAVDASDLLIRLGRLIYADPAWTPGPRGTTQVVPPEQLAPDAGHAARIGLAVLNSIEACNVMAAAHNAAVNDVARITLTRRGLAAPDGRRRPPAVARQFLTRYEGVLQHGKEAVIHLGNTVLELTPKGSETAAEAALIIRRANAPNSHESPAALAAQSFPSLTTQALHTLAQQAASPSSPVARPKSNSRAR
ncbi:hypothetical protein SAMN04489712_10212 [Thermomonospora echinospora]|uniref:Uncharacterized protein n=1 Tax=Thermomonospora echinospora TaxID=1992 RepID=A0A1H5UVK3_9ACTN|nr:hypothetical protein [Thermomonospora echinospora]SEF78237.1 hypothetical protein SAMN04489712_10212 [Thermomonospora echinospora]